MEFEIVKDIDKAAGTFTNISGVSAPITADKVYFKKVNDRFETHLSDQNIELLPSSKSDGNSKFLKAKDIGLIAYGTALVTSPFTSPAYDAAYNNGINLSRAIKQAHDEGYSGIVLEKGIYPFTANKGTSDLKSGSSGFSCVISGLRNFNLNFNGSTFFIMYDSLNRNPYDTSSDPIHELPFQMINIRDCRHVDIFNLELRGDNYMRAWVAGEEGDIGCYGLTLGVDSQYIRIHNYEGHGFRCEPLACSYAGYADIALTWASGGLDASGADIVEVGSYRTGLKNLKTSGFKIVDNSISVIGTGFTREIQFRKSLIKIFYYESDGTFISSDWTIQNKLNYLPTGCTQIQLVAYDDERTDPTVDYNACAITSGTSRNLEVTGCKFYNNMRGCIAGVSNNTLIENCVFHTIGFKINEKYGWSVYGDTTQFAIDIEDGMPDFVTIRNNRFENCGHAILTPACQTLVFTGNLCQDIYWNSTIINCKYADISGNIFNGGSSIGGGVEIQSTLAFSERSTKITNNIFVDNELRVTCTNNLKNTAFVDNNTYLNSRVILNGNVISGVNYHYDFDIPFQSPIEVTDVIQFNDIIEEKDGLTSWELYKISTRKKDSKAVFNIRSNAMRFSIADSLKVPSIHFFGADTSNQINFYWHLTNVYTQTFNGSIFENLKIALGELVEYATLPDFTVNYNNCKFITADFRLSRRVTTNAGIITINFNGCEFDFTYATNLYIFSNSYTNTGGQVILNFVDCDFKSATAKTIEIDDNVAMVGLSVTFTRIDTRNVTLVVNNATPISKFKTPNPNAPSYADNATALAALGEGWIYKNTTSGKFDTTNL